MSTAYQVLERQKFAKKLCLGLHCINATVKYQVTTALEVSITVEFY